MSERVRIEAPDAGTATDLLDRLLRFDCRLSTYDDGRCDVAIQSPLSGGDLNRLIDDVLDTVERWLAANRLAATTIQIGDEAYHMEPFRAPGENR